MAREKALVRNPRSDGRIAHVGKNVLGKSIRADAHVDTGPAIAVERLHYDAKLQVLERAVGHRRAGVGDDLEIIAVRIRKPTVAADKNTVRQRNFGIEKADLLEQLNGRAALALHHGMELEKIDRRVNLHA